MKTFSNASPGDAQTLSSYADFIALAVIVLVLGTGAGTPLLSFFYSLGLMPQ
jgi:hypothetical protein